MQIVRPYSWCLWRFSCRRFISCIVDVFGDLLLRSVMFPVVEMVLSARLLISGKNGKLLLLLVNGLYFWVWNELKVLYRVVFKLYIIPISTYKDWQKETQNRILIKIVTILLTDFILMGFCSLSLGKFIVVSSEHSFYNGLSKKRKTCARSMLPTLARSLSENHYLKFQTSQPHRFCPLSISSYKSLKFVSLNRFFIYVPRLT